MKTSKSRARSSTLAHSPDKSDFRREVQDFMMAVNSYPDRVARDPGVSFQRHLFNVMSASRRSSGRRNYPPSILGQTD